MGEHVEAARLSALLRILLPGPPTARRDKGKTQDEWDASQPVDIRKHLSERAGRAPPPSQKSVPREADSEVGGAAFDRARST